MQAMLRKSATEAAAGSNLEALLGIFSKLLASKRHHQDGFVILDGIVSHLPTSTFQHFLPKVALLPAESTVHRNLL